MPLWEGSVAVTAPILAIVVEADSATTRAGMCGRGHFGSIVERRGVGRDSTTEAAVDYGLTIECAESPLAENVSLIPGFNDVTTIE
jgi:hypothetical protein